MTRLHCLLNIFFCVCVCARVCVYTYVYMHTLPCVCIYMCDCDLCNTNYGIGQLLSIHPIILFSGIVASIYTAAFLLRLIGCCCFLCTKEKCQTNAACSGNGCSHLCSYVLGNIFHYFSCDLTIKTNAGFEHFNSTKNNIFKVIVAP